MLNWAQFCRWAHILDTWVRSLIFSEVNVAQHELQPFIEGLMTWMNDITAAILSDFPNSWICRSIITYLSRGEVSISQIGGSGSGKKAHRRQSGFEKAAHQFTSNINAVSPPRPLHLSQLQLSLRRQILNTQILCLDFQRISTISLNHEDRVIGSI